MANERLRGSIAAAGLRLAEVAEGVSVDPKTVARWIATDRVPHRTHRGAAARLLGVDETYLWPQAVGEARATDASRAEFLTFYPHRGAVPLELWQSLLTQASETIDVLVYAGQFLTDTFPDLANTLAARGRAGVRVRLLLGEPESDAVRVRGHEEGIDGDLAARIRLSQRYLMPAAGSAGVEMRQHATTLYASIFRCDDDMLVNAHVYGAPALHSPVFHLHRVPGGRLFEHYLASLERVWETSGSSR